MVGGWQWKNKRIKKLMMTKNILSLILKSLIPFQSFRKKIRKKIQRASTTKVMSMSLETKKNLQNFYRKDVQLLSDLLNKDLNNWMQ
jgi:hypothetical protein